MVLGVFFPFDGLVLIAMTVAYFLCPKKYLENKLDYVKFFLTYASVYASIFMLIHALFYTQISGTEAALQSYHAAFALGIAPTLWVAHRLWPFKQVKRNQHISFFSAIIALGEIAAIALLWLMVALSEM